MLASEFRPSEDPFFGICLLSTRPQKRSSVIKGDLREARDDISILRSVAYKLPRTLFLLFFVLFCKPLWENIGDDDELRENVHSFMGKMDLTVKDIAEIKFLLRFFTLHLLAI